jgi:hypothetical protein
MPESAKPNNENSITLKPTPKSSGGSERNLETLSWISDQLTILAEAFGEPLTAERMEIYVGGLADVSRDCLQVAFGRALRELKWFPKVSELRDLSETKTDEQKKVEAEAAWDHINKYLRKWGVDRVPVYSGGGKWITAPPLEPRLEYALRQIGGLWRLNQVTDESYFFVHRDFCEAYALAQTAELMEPHLLEQFGERRLLGSVRQLTDASKTEDRTSGAGPTSPGGFRHQRGASAGERPAITELSAERKAELRRQLEEELAKRGIPKSVGGLH